MAGSAIKLIVGLGNPGVDYANTRHNAGAWFVDALAEQADVALRKERKFSGMVATVHYADHSVYLLIPAAFMNHSGQAVQAMCRFYQFKPEHVLVAHDELDLPPGCARLKVDGGHGGHNGLRDVIRCLGTNQFQRLRLGIGHPGHKDQVHNFVLSKPSRHDQQCIQSAIQDALAVLPLVLDAKMQQAMTQLHTVGMSNGT